MQPINMKMIYYWEKKLKKYIVCSGSWYNNLKKKHWFDVSCSKDAFFWQDVFQMTCLSNKSLIGGIYFETPRL